MEPMGASVQFVLDLLNRNNLEIELNRADLYESWEVLDGLLASEGGENGRYD